nr:MAG TPA: hypothetical protein [Caudoviricetes sp.]
MVTPPPPRSPFLKGKPTTGRGHDKKATRAYARKK